jgi:hypothetical protein
MCNEVEIVSARMICFREILQKLNFKIKKNILSHISCSFKGKTFEIVFFFGEYLTTFAHTVFNFGVVSQQFSTVWVQFFTNLLSINAKPFWG